MFKIKLLLSLLFCLLSILNQAQDNDALFVKANEQAASRSYAQAVETYQQLLASGVQSAEVEFNLANAYLALNEIGQAILHYERAAHLSPNDAEIQQNLRLARERTENDLSEQPAFFLAEAWNSIKMSAGSGFWSFLTLLFLWAGVAGLILWQIGKERKRRKQGFFVGIAFLILTLFPFFLGSGKASLERDSQAGIILAKETQLHASASENSPTIRQVPLGAKVIIEDNINDWYKVQLANGEEGWLIDSTFEKI